ncbi:MAG: prepilin-type N-terminal cleavage/methylation domain-containing protein [Phycisphaeraceae bacterium]|nr:prepilin-type N-terminal cleavage/methylation domain-containing protein [Phycisphaeraceae bacterium]
MFSRKGFTLIELLVVISIIAILIAILLPALRKSRDIAISTQCLAQIRQIAVASNAYAADEDGWYPSRPAVAFQPHFMRSSPSFDLNETFIFKYVGQQSMRDKVMFCPGAIYEVRNPTSSGYGYIPNSTTSNRNITYQYINVQNSTQPRQDPPDVYKAYDDELARDTARGWMPLWGDMDLRTTLGAVLSHEIPLLFFDSLTGIAGGNFVTCDASGRWYRDDELEPYIGSTNVYYRPDVDDD